MSLPHLRIWIADASSNLGQRSIFLREHLSRYGDHFLRKLFPHLQPDKDNQDWSDPQRFHVPAPQDAGAHRTPYAAAISSQP